MHTSKAVLAMTAVLLVGCADDTSGPTRVEPTEAGRAALTPDERDDFLDQVAGLGYTCRDALPDRTTHVACTRPGTGPEAGHDTVRLTSTPHGNVVRVSYCGPNAEIGTAFSAAFLSEIGSPDLSEDLPIVEVPVLACVSGSGTGFAAGGPADSPLATPDLAEVRGRLTAAGWTCRDDTSAKLDCTAGPESARSIVSGVVSELAVAGPDAAALAAAASDLGLDRTAVDAASACGPDTTCDHLVVDGFDVTLDADREHARMRLRPAAWS